MADETPKKVVEDSSRCFTCPSLSADNNRVFIFGKSDHSFADIIKTSLNVDVINYHQQTEPRRRNRCNSAQLKIFLPLVFCSTNSKQPLPASVRPLAYFPEVSSPIQPVENQNYRLVFNAFPNTHLGSSQEFRPALTSTPTSAREQNVNQVKLSVQYSSKPLNKKLSEAYQTIGKALAHGVPSRIAGAIMNCQPVRKQIVEKVMKIIS